MKSFRESTLLALWAIAVIVVDIASAGHATAETSPRHTPFVTVLLRDWSRWDTNGDGVISADEINRAVADPAIKGEDAAATGTLKLMSRNSDASLPAFKQRYFTAYDTYALLQQDGIKISVPKGKHIVINGISCDPQQFVDWNSCFTSAKQRIAQSGGAWPARLTLDDASQGSLNDCFLIATLGSMVAHNPVEVRHLITPQIDGAYRVTLPGAAPFRLQPPTQSQLVLGSTTGGRGDWLAVFEQAIGQFSGAHHLFAGEGTDNIDSGGQIGQTMSMLTGHEHKCIHIWMTVADRRARADKQLPLLRNELTSAMHEHRAITTDVLSPDLPPSLSFLAARSLPKIPPDISAQHAYAVIGYDADSDLLEVWNPHGQDFSPAGPDGLENGYITQHGRFKIPLTDAYGFFTDFIFESATPASGLGSHSQ